MTVPKTFWNGEPCNAVRGTGVVADDPVFPKYWARDLIGSRIAVVRVLYAGDQFDLDDRDGAAWAKVTTGHGGPSFGHRTVKLEPNTAQWESWRPFLDEFAKREGLEAPA